MYPKQLQEKRSESNQGQGFQPWLGRKKKNINEEDEAYINYLWSVLGKLEFPTAGIKRGMNTKFTNRFGRTPPQVMSRFGRNNYQWSRMRRNANQAGFQWSRMRKSSNTPIPNKNQYQWGHL